MKNVYGVQEHLIGVKRWVKIKGNTDLSFGLQSPVFVSLPISPLSLIITYVHCESFMKNIYAKTSSLITEVH